MKNYKELLRHIKAFVFDYDGTLTDGTVILLDEGEPLRTANVRDGYAIQLAVKKGYQVVIISGGRSKSMSNRFRMLRVQHVFLGIEHKLETLRKFLEENGLEPENVLYLGDDIPDYHAMKYCGVAACPADAAEEIKSISHYISHYKGGEGCARDVIEQVLKVQGQWMNDDAFAW
ncbi:MAG TPA: HAD-IIIA family hydrolase [Bacteroidales bacterium]|nr:HAD-IIIA family hydrolase [Bacteroidales bacterium]HOX78356.1 HAD-IIIA family hydrolase [Bacteroidales bacterium]HPI85078.1 HAD-IIIA family hydrolase [Bacteroidales bacterium]HPM93650.1 HAD-IIIA family hydrolase [Bacteroidales bacterium]